jgi:predicted ester cyclase
LRPSGIIPSIIDEGTRVRRAIASLQFKTIGDKMPTHLTPEQMKHFVQNHFEDLVNKRNAAVIRKNMTADFYDHDGPGGKPTDLTGDEQTMVGMYKAMPDLHLTIEEMIAEGDKVVCRNTWRWTDPSGKRMQFHGFVLWRFEGDKIAERWATVTPPSEGASWADAPRLAGTRAS